jgi:hypothetical protein
MARRRDRVEAEFGVVTADTKGGNAMTAEQLKRKLRNFPAANLGQRLPAAA